MRGRARVCVCVRAVNRVECIFVDASVVRGYMDRVSLCVCVVVPVHSTEFHILGNEFSVRIMA